MHRSYPSRGRVLFEVLCALGMSASFAGAWMQTHATALLGAAGVAALYGLFHLFDLKQPRAAGSVEPQRIDFQPEPGDIIVPMVGAEEEPEAEAVGAEVEAVEPVAARAGTGRRSGSRKGGGRRAKAPKGAKAVPVEARVVAEVPVPERPEEMAVELAPEEEFVFQADDEPAHPHIAPLFEPEPFARMQRRAFGRRGRL